MNQELLKDLREAHSAAQEAVVALSRSGGEQELLDDMEMAVALIEAAIQRLGGDDDLADE